MSVSLVVTRSFDRDYKETGNRIAMADWGLLVDTDENLTLRTDPLRLAMPDGSLLSVKAPMGQSLLTLSDGSSVSFLSLLGGELVMPYHFDMELPDNPLRLKISEIARHFDALITSDAGDAFFEW